MSSGARPPVAHGLEVVDETLLRAFQDVARQALERGSGALPGLLRFGALRLEVVGERRDGILAPVVEEVLGQALFLVRDRRVSDDLLGVDDGEVEPRARRMVEKHRVEDLAPRLGKAEADVGDPEDRLRLRERRLDQADPLDRLLGAADVLRVAGAAREDQRVEEDVLGRELVLFGQERVAAPGDLELAVARDGHPVLGILVDRSDHEGRAVPLRQRHDRLEALLAVLEVDRVQDRLALAPLQAELQDLRVRRVEHERDLDHLRRPLEEGVDVGDLVAVRVLQADVDDLRAVLDLGAGDLRGRLELPVGHEPLELAAAEDVRPLAHEDRPVVDVHLEHLDPGDERLVVDRHAPGLLAGGRGRERPDVRRRRAAAAAHDVDPPLGHEPAELAWRATPGSRCTCHRRPAARRSDSRRFASSRGPRACGCGPS